MHLGMVFCSGFFVGLFIWVVSGFILFVSFVFLSIALIQSYLFLIEVSSAQPQSSQNIVFTNIPSNFQVNFNYRQNSRIILDRVVFVFFFFKWLETAADCSPDGTAHLWYIVLSMASFSNFSKETQPSWFCLNVTCLCKHLKRNATSFMVFITWYSLGLIHTSVAQVWPFSLRDYFRQMIP